MDSDSAVEVINILSTLVIEGESHCKEVTPVDLKKKTVDNESFKMDLWNQAQWKIHYFY